MKLTAWDRFTLSLAPKWTLERLKARSAAGLLERTYEAASQGRRTSGWARNRGDVNALIEIAGPELRLHARDLLRNNSWTRRARGIVANSVVGWGLVPKPSAAGVADAWRAWADSTDCDADGRSTFAGIQHLVIRSVFSDGEVLIRRRQRRPGDGLLVPLQLQVLEADHLDSSRNDGARIRGGIEFDGIGRRVAYWLFPEHPGSTRVAGMVSRRVPAEDVIHAFYAERPGQIRGVSWLGSAIVNLKDLDEYEDAEIVKQKIAACFAAFVTDNSGGSPLGALETDPLNRDVETFEPGMIHHLPAGREVTVASPPQVTDSGFSIRALRKIAAGVGITYEDLTGDFSQVNFSSARMGRIAFQGNVADWQANMMIPQVCAQVWRWFAQTANLVGIAPADVTAEWTAPPLPMIEPDKEIRASTQAVRSGVQTLSEVIRERGGDPEAHWAEYAADMARLDALKIKLDSDVRATSQAGLTQERAGLSPKPGGAPAGDNAPPANDGA